MFDILKDSNGRFNKKNILPLVGASVAGTMTALSVAAAITVFLPILPYLTIPTGEIKVMVSFLLLTYHLP